MEIVKKEENKKYIAIFAPYLIPQIFFTEYPFTDYKKEKKRRRYKHFPNIDVI